MPNLPVNIDATYGDDTARPGIKAHQQHHDVLHALNNSAGQPNGLAQLGADGKHLPSQSGTVGAVRYIGSAGNDANTGLTLADPKLTLGAAVAALGGRGKVVVAGGFGVTAPITITGASNIIVQGLGPFSVFEAQANMTDVLRFVNCSNIKLADFKVQVAAGFTVTNGLHITQAAGSSQQSNLHDVWVTNGSGTMTNCFAVGTDTDGDVSQVAFFGCTGAGAVQAAFRCGNGTPGNVYDIHMIGCLARNSGYGVYCDGSAATWEGGDFLGNSISDWFVGTPAIQAPCSATGFHSETSARFLATGGPSSSGLHFTIGEAVWIASAVNADKKWIDNRLGGMLTLAGVRAHGSADLIISAPNATVAGVGVESTSKAETVIAALDFTIAGYVQRSADGSTLILRTPFVASRDALRLAAIAYNPATAASASSTSATFADVDATNLVVSFVVPASGAVWVEMEAIAYGMGASDYIDWNLRSGVTNVAGSAMRIAGALSASNQIRHRYKNKITGLTPGAALTWKWGFANETGTANPVTVTWGGVVGPAVMEVRAA